VKKILFVCTGNTCRSPLAHAFLEKKANTEKLAIEVKSAGIAAKDGLDVSTNTKEVLKEKKIPFKHKTKKLNKELVAWADLILAMSFVHKHYIINLYPQASSKIFTLKEYIEEDKSKVENKEKSKDSSLEIIDPFGLDLEVYRKCASEIEECIMKMLKILKKEGSESN